MKRNLLFLLMALLPMVASADETQDMTVSDVQNSGCVKNTRANTPAKARGTEIEPSIILTKEGSILMVQLFNYQSTCGTEGFDVVPSISGGSNGTPLSVSIQVIPIIGEDDADCICPYNISFTIHGLEANSFYFSCVGYKELVNLTEGEPFELWREKEINIDGVTYRLDREKKTATVMDGHKYEGELNIPSEVSYEGQVCAVTDIHYFAFYTDTKLTSVSIPNSMKSISVRAFSGCENLKDIYCYAENVPYATDDAFEVIHTSATLHVPAGSVDKYKATAPWSNFKTIVPMTLKINEATFPDENFRDCLFSHPYGTDGVLTDEEIANFQTVDVRFKEIHSLTGLEYFTSLKNLLCSDNKLTELDVSKNPTLSYLLCSNNQLTSLDLSKNPELGILTCSSNQLTELDVSKNLKLYSFLCDNNQLTELDVSNNSNLMEIFCTNNHLKKLTLSSHPKMREIKCYNNLLTELDISKCTTMLTLQCYNNSLTALDLSNNTRIRVVECYKNCIRGTAMDTLIESLPFISGSRRWQVIFCEDEHNMMTKTQVAAAKDKGWVPYACTGLDVLGSYEWEEYEGSDPIEPVSFTAGQMATIVLPTVPDASKGKYYRLDRCEDGQIIFVQELQPQAHIPYIIVPSEDFSIDTSTLDLAGLSNDTVSIGGISFIGSYVGETLNEPEGFYIDIIDTTPDCSLSLSGETGKVAHIGALRAYLQVSWDEPYNHGGSKVPGEKMGIVLRDYGTGISSLTPDPIPGREDEMFNSQRSMFNDIIYDLSGRKINSSFFTLHSSLKKGIYIKDGKKMIK